jgi:hypothetical protein
MAVGGFPNKPKFTATKPSEVQMIITTDIHQPTPIERLLDWTIKYKLLKYGEEQLRNEPTESNQPTEEIA